MSWQQHELCHFVLFFLWCTFLVPSFKNTALIFLEIFLIKCCTVLVESPMTSSLSSFASYKNAHISKTKKDIPKRKTPFFFTLKSLSNKQQLISLHRHFNSRHRVENGMVPLCNFDEAIWKCTAGMSNSNVELKKQTER